MHEVEPEEPEQLKRLECVETGVEKTEKFKTLYLAYPVQSKKASVVADVIQALVLSLEREGVTVKRFHSDKGSEFKNQFLTPWLKNKNIHVTATAGADPKQMDVLKTELAILNAKHVHALQVQVYR